jgi:hypothetical protein
MFVAVAHWSKTSSHRLYYATITNREIDLVKTSSLLGDGDSDDVDQRRSLLGDLGDARGLS